MRIETERLLLREMNRDDYDARFMLFWQTPILCSIIRTHLMRREYEGGSTEIWKDTGYLDSAYGRSV